jgi:16S rRNA (cytosine1402-N4)-methyltransferase
MIGFAHTTVLLREVVADVAACPAARQPGALIIDATLGGGGHAGALLEALPDARLIGLDRDPAALAAAQDRLHRFGARLQAIHVPFSQLMDVVGEATQVAAVIADLGVSSPQLDEPARGFSFQHDGPLDMRMDPSRGKPLHDKLARVTIADLADVLYEYGDVRHSIGTAKLVLKALDNGADTTTKLSEFLQKRLPRERSHHPATAVFQALRMWVNDEAGELDALLATAPDLLQPGGAFGVIAFHSGEDRRVKTGFAEREQAGNWRRLRRKPVVPSDSEIERNPRSRSAKLRWLGRVQGDWPRRGKFVPGQDAEDRD